jgi:ABC-2 type transport system permease protein
MASGEAILAHGSAAKRTSSPWLSGFVAATISEIKSLYREPAALAFTLGQPIVLLVILVAFDLHTTLPNGKVVPYLDVLVPGLIAFIGMTVGLNGVLFPLSRYKERGILRRVAATPMPTGSFVVAMIVSRLLIALAVTLITWIFGVYVFGADLTGSAVLLIAFATIGSLAFIALGILMVAFARSEDDVAPLMMLVLIPSILFSGAFLDRSGLPDWLHWITSGLPLTFLTDAVQQIANLGHGLTALGTDILGLAIWCVGATILAAWRFKMA